MFLAGPGLLAYKHSLFIFQRVFFLNYFQIQPHGEKKLLSPSIKEKLRFRKNLRILLKRMCRYKAFLVCGRGAKGQTEAWKGRLHYDGNTGGINVQ